MDSQTFDRISLFLNLWEINLVSKFVSKYKPTLLLLKMHIKVLRFLPKTLRLKSTIAKKKIMITFWLHYICFVEIVISDWKKIYNNDDKY